MSGFGKIVLPPLTMVPPSTARSYLIAARDMLEGAEVLASSKPRKLLACAFLSGQSLECALKAFLSATGWAETELKSKSIRHNLNALWVECYRSGLAIHQDPARWCSLLNSAHDSPYYFRYPMKINGMVLPEPNQMINELRVIVDLVAEVVK